MNNPSEKEKNDNHYAKQYTKENLEIELPYDQAIPLLKYIAKDMKSLCLKDICTSMFIKAQLIIPKRQGQTRCPLMYE